MERKGRWKKERERGITAPSELSNSSRHAFGSFLPHSLEADQLFDTFPLSTACSSPKVFYLVWSTLFCDSYSQLFHTEK